ncbi:MAG: hypothetical protein ACTH31_11940 [Pseudoclavibacter sp.]
MSEETEDEGLTEEPDNGGVGPDGADAIRYRGADGEWHEFDVEPKRTGDPDLDTVWAMSFDELEAILDDESHPLHAKAKQVAVEMSKPLVEAAAELMRPLAESAMRGIDMSGWAQALVPKIDFTPLYPALDTSSWFAKLVPNLPKLEVPDNIWKNIAASARIEPPAVLEPPERRGIDFQAVEPPDASAAEIQGAAEARAHEMRSKQFEVLTDLLSEARANSKSGEEALNVSKQALEATKKSVDEARGSKCAAWAAAIIGAMGLIATVVFGILST